MKKTILVLAVLVAGVVMFTSCKEIKKENHEHGPETHEHTNESDMHDAEKTAHSFQCPMDCEKGKTYEEKGSCPVCKMDLKEKKEGEKKEHAENCKCLEGGECKCEDGKCECKEEMAISEMDCSHCIPGSCKCSA